jgi:hypothetical protein
MAPFKITSFFSNVCHGQFEAMSPLKLRPYFTDKVKQGLGIIGVWFTQFRAKNNIPSNPSWAFGKLKD